MVAKGKKRKRTEILDKKMVPKDQSIKKNKKKVTKQQSKNTSTAFSALKDRIRRINKPVIDTDDNNLEEFVDVGPIEETESTGHHDKLVESIKRIKNQTEPKIKPIEIRCEPTDKVSELNLTRHEYESENTKNNEKSGSSDQKCLNVSELLQTAKDVSGVIDKSVKRLKKRKLIEPPLNCIESGLIERRTNHEIVLKKISKWQPIVDAHSVASQLSFPLETPSLHMETASEVTSRYQSKNEMEAKIDSLLKSSKNHLKDEALLTVAEEEFLKSISLQEAQERHSALQKMRALLSYQETKLRRRKKIKSRSFHRILKKDKLRDAMKEFEELKERDPERALEKLNELDKIRALERVTLRHKSTGRWAKQNKLRAVYDDTARAQLADQVELSQVLMKKRKLEESDAENEEDAKDGGDAEEDEDGDAFKIAENFNPWMKNQRTIIQEQIRMSDADNPVASDATKQIDAEQKEKVDAKKVVTKEIKKSYYQRVTDMKSDSESDAEEENANGKLISEAFADDDVTIDFKKDKEAVASEETPTDVDTFLPGWGSWSGPDIDTNSETIKKRREKSVIKAPKRMRKDATLGNVIISEKANASFERLLVRQLPRDFKSVPEFESLISTPIGRTWNTQLSFQTLTEPAIITKMGTIIDAMTPESLTPFSSKKSYAKMKKIQKKGDAKK